MQIRDDGNQVTISSVPMLIGKIFAVVFVVLGTLFPIMMVLALVLPARTASIDCDRARGTCVFALSNSRRNSTIPIQDVVSAQVLYSHGRRNASASHYVTVTTRDGHSFDLGEQSFHDDVTAGFRTAVTGLNHFIADPSQPSFRTTFVGSDNDWAALIWFTLITPLAAWFFLRAWITRLTEIDRSRRTIRFQSIPKIGARTDDVISLDQITAIRLFSANWTRITIATADRTFVVAIVPRTGSYIGHVRQIVGTIASLTGIRPLVTGTQPSFWGV